MKLQGLIHTIEAAQQTQPKKYGLVVELQALSKKELIEFMESVTTEGTITFEVLKK